MEIENLKFWKWNKVTQLKISVVAFLFFSVFPNREIWIIAFFFMLFFGVNDYYDWREGVR